MVNWFLTKVHGPVNGERRIFSTNYVETTECVCVCTRTCKHGSVTQSCLNLCDPLDCSLPGSSVHGIFQARVGCHFLLQGIFLTQGSNPCLLCLLHWQVDSLPSEPPGKGMRAPPSYPTSRPFCGASGFRDFVLLLKSSRALLIFLKQINFNLL